MTPICGVCRQRPSNWSPRPILAPVKVAPVALLEETRPKMRKSTHLGKSEILTLLLPSHHAGPALKTARTIIIGMASPWVNEDLIQNVSYVIKWATL